MGGEATRLSEAENDGRCALFATVIFLCFSAKNALCKHYDIAYRLLLLQFDTSIGTRVSFMLKSLLIYV